MWRRLCSLWKQRRAAAWKTIKKSKQEALVFLMSLRTCTRPWIEGHSPTQRSISAELRARWRILFLSVALHTEELYHTIPQMPSVLSPFRWFTTFTECHEICSDRFFCVNLVYGSSTKGHTSVSGMLTEVMTPETGGSSYTHKSLKKTTAGRWRLCSKGTVPELC